MAPSSKAFPVFTCFEVRKFGLYPGTEDEADGVRIDFFPGITLIVGANGLGKTTLITMIFRMITGPFDIPQLRSGDDLGFRRLEARRLPINERNTFAARVSDRALDATAHLEFQIGSKRVTIDRRLSDLALQEARVDSTTCRDEKTFQTLLATSAGLGSFGDLILMLRYLVFYFEDRRQLVWDASAQRQLLRMLFLPPNLAQRWTALERSILQNDSRMRNFQAVVGREERHLARALARTSNAPSLRAELQSLEELQEPDQDLLEELEAMIAELDRLRQDARLSDLHARQERETRFRAYEHAKLAAIDSRFPGNLETGRYILAHLMADQYCLVCGKDAPDTARDYAERLHLGRCLVCNSALSQADRTADSLTAADEAVTRAERSLKTADREVVASSRSREDAEREYNNNITRITQLRSEIATRSARLAELIEALPPGEAQLRSQRVELTSIRARLATMKSELAKERSEFREFVGRCTEDLLSSSEEIVELFTEFAGKFLSEKISLSWKTRPETVGQGGESIPFPAFELDMSGGDFVDTVRRAGPGDVSASQREFIDLSFRMALMRAAGTCAAGIVIDTPESSLDAVFAKRAGDTLIAFGEGGGNTVVVTSNLIEGSLLPSLIANIATTDERRRRLVDLFEVARPTAAVTAERREYDLLRKALFGAL